MIEIKLYELARRAQDSRGRPGTQQPVAEGGRPTQSDEGTSVLLIVKGNDGAMGRSIPHVRAN